VKVSNEKVISNTPYGVCFVGGTSKGYISLRSLALGKRLMQNALSQDYQFLTYASFRTKKEKRHSSPNSFQESVGGSCRKNQMNLQDTPLGRHAPSIVNVVIEVPKGSKKKYHYHTRSRKFKLAYKFSIPVPTEYGWIPETIAEDGHFLNAMVIARHSTHPGYICEARPIGILKRKDNDHHVICVLLGDERYTSVQDIFDLDVKLLKKIVHFFEPYFELSGWLGRAETIQIIKTAHERYMVKRSTRIATAQARKMNVDEASLESFDQMLGEADEPEDDSEWDDAYNQEEEEDADSDN